MRKKYGYYCRLYDMVGKRAHGSLCYNHLGLTLMQHSSKCKYLYNYLIQKKINVAGKKIMDGILFRELSI